MTTKRSAPGPKNPGAQGDQQGTRSTPMLPRATDDSVPQQIRRRRAAALRCPPLDDGHRDPMDRLARIDKPSTYGMTESQLRAYANHLVLNEGWSPWEVRQRLAITPRPPCCPCCRHHQEAAA